MGNTTVTDAPAAVARHSRGLLQPAPRRWFCDYLPITEGNQLRQYVDGRDYCSDLYDDLTGASGQVLLTGLHFMADFSLKRGTGNDAQYRLSEVLKSVAQRGVEVFLLVNQFWTNEYDVGNPIKKLIKRAGELDGYLPQTLALFNALAAFPNIRCRTDIHPGFVFHSHHQKTVVIDERCAYVGGIDLTYIDGDRWDTPEHGVANRTWERTQKYWHDVHSRIEGPAVSYVVDNFQARWNYGELYTLRGVTTERQIPDRTTRDGFVYRGRTIREYTIEAVPDPEDRRYRFAPRVESPSQTYSPNYASRHHGGENTAGALREPLVQVVRSMPRGKYFWEHPPATPERYPSRQKPVWNQASAQRRFLGRALEDDWERSCKDAYIIGIQAARESIYLENQWISDEDVWSAPGAAVTRNRDNPNFRLVIMLPQEPLAAAGLGANQDIAPVPHLQEIIARCREVRTFGVYCLVQALPPAAGSTAPREAPIYVHSKLMVVDDCWVLIGSANAGGMSLEGVRNYAVGSGAMPDTELGIIVLDAPFASGLRQTIWREHLQGDPGATFHAGADRFMEIAFAGGQRTRFLPAFQAARPRNGWVRSGWAGVRNPVDPDVVEHCRRNARIETDPPGTTRISLGQATPFTLVMPDPPPTYRAWYRWSCRDAQNGAWLMRGVANDRIVQQYSNESSAYIAELSAAALSRAGRQNGKILCRVQLTPANGQPARSNTDGSFVTELACEFVP